MGTALRVRYWCGKLFVCCVAASLPLFPQEPATPALNSPQTRSSDTKKNYLVLDIVVTDKSGKAVTKVLEEKDFSVEDSGKPEKIITFRAVPGEVLERRPPDRTDARSILCAASSDRLTELKTVRFA
jgi:hypothetical protein